MVAKISKVMAAWMSNRTDLATEDGEKPQRTSRLVTRRQCQPGAMPGVSRLVDVHPMTGANGMAGQMFVCSNIGLSATVENKPES